MAANDGKISGLTRISGLDRANDLFEVDDVSLGASKSATVNDMLGITGAPLGTTDTQSPQNKTFDNTNAITVKANAFTIQDPTDTTKQAVFSAAGITTGTTRTYILPNANDTLVGLAAAQTLTNKTFTAPVLNTPTINNPALNTDSISEYTANNGVTVDGMNIMNGKLNTNNSVITANLTDAAVTPAKLVAGTGASWGMQAWVPTLTNITKGDGTVTALYIQTGKVVKFLFNFTLGSTSAIGTDPKFSLPVATSASAYASSLAIGVGTLLQTGTAEFPGIPVWFDANTCMVRCMDASVAIAKTASVTAAVPFSWGASHVLWAAGEYQAA